MTLANPQLKTLRRRICLASISILICLLGTALDRTSVAWAAPPAEQPPAAAHVEAADQHAAQAPEEHGAQPQRDVAPPVYAVLPFVALLLGIALLPLSYKTAHWWEKNSSKLMVSAACGVMTFVFYSLLYGSGVHDHGTHELSAAGVPAAVTVLKNAILVEYVPFMVLLFSLYVISGGINIVGRMRGTPRTNATFLLIGSLLASLIGTTGAAMVLIRPLLKANSSREHISHTVVFFIFVVCNTGGCLLPIGDPPLFLGYLSGVDFFWTLNLTPHWALMNAIIILTYLGWDSFYYRKEKPFETGPDANAEPFAIRGSLNILWLIMVIVCVALLDPAKPIPGTNFKAPIYLREGLMLGLTGLSLVLTSKAIREANSFNYDAIIEVGVLFVGIFICMQAPIQILNVHGAALGIDQPWKFYWCTGALSSFLDNAPTYVVFFETAKTVPATSPLVNADMVPIGIKELAAISTGAVFMGSMTYIGNGPNLMVRAIAEKSNVRMPSFFGYMAYSCAVVLPASVLLTLVFFR